MNSSVHAPFKMRELAGTSWYRRFVAEEFDIYLDHYPQRIILGDRIADGADLSKEQMESYKKSVLSFFREDAYGDLSPGELLGQLRRIRFNQIGTDPGLGCSSTFLTSRGVDALLKEAYPGAEIELDSAWKEALTGAKRVYLYSAGIGHLPVEISCIRMLGRADIVLVCTSRPGDPGLSQEEARRFMALYPSSDIAVSEAYTNLPGEYSSALPGDGLIFCANLWSYLQLFRSHRVMALLLDSRQWFARGLFQESYEEDGSDDAEPLHPGAYEGLLEELPSRGFAVYAGVQSRPFPSTAEIGGVQYASLSLRGHCRGRKPISLCDRLSQQLEQLEADGWDDCINGFFRLEKQGLVGSDPDDPSSLLISACSAPEKELHVRPRFFTKRADPAALAFQGDSAIVGSFSYYFTENLRILHNREEDRSQQISYRDLFIDYLAHRRQGELRETIPLYRKAMLGCTVSGELFAGHFPLKALEIEGHDGKGRKLFSHRFDTDRIDPSDGGEGVYRPLCSTAPVGEGKYCLVLVQDQPVYQGMGPCDVPSIGICIVLDEAVPRIQEFRFRCTLEGLPCEREAIQWLCGGFNILLEQGENLYSDFPHAERSLQAEGWMSKASSKTQETQLDPKVRQPRCAFGRTDSGRLILLSIAGRSKYSSGARFDELVQAARLYCGDSDPLAFLINFDGGASAALNHLRRDGSCNTLGLTAPSLSNPAGTARRLSAYFTLEKRDLRGE